MRSTVRNKTVKRWSLVNMYHRAEQTLCHMLLRCLFSDISQWSSGATRTSFEGEKGKSGRCLTRYSVPTRSTMSSLWLEYCVALCTFRGGYCCSTTVLVYTRTPENRYRSRRHRPSAVCVRWAAVGRYFPITAGGGRIEKQHVDSQSCCSTPASKKKVSMRI